MRSLGAQIAAIRNALRPDDGKRDVMGNAGHLLGCEQVAPGGKGSRTCGPDFGGSRLRAATLPTRRAQTTLLPPRTLAVRLPL